jgi:cytidine deaminase
MTLKLLQMAVVATDLSYAPYSHYKVGCAIRMEDGSIVKGANQRMPPTLCAFVPKALH